ncbi:helix-turn-helix transcriptional regulator [Clostridium paridis]|uniref:Helix-turn-helix transcriptional regulator n=1 Tax=Clostridium paridis TaxID=2803863 RepID=A0A937FFH2_9CLOT|nr:helix-turn-helix transcriptional regulator [Clostridium paridis]MBL4932228.1 helix-turn-helix transcriptional regulator [Clostridium paridis]
MEHDLCIRESIKYIENNLKEKIELKELADKAFLSKYHYHRIFHAIVGEPVAEYVRKRRLEEAANELISSDNKIVDIALKYQFGSQETFTKAFKKVYGVPPREFRENRSKIALISSRNKGISKLSMVA